MIHRASNGTVPAQPYRTGVPAMSPVSRSQRKERDEEGQRPVGSERGGDVTERGGLLALGPEIHKFPASDEPDSVVYAL